MNPSGDKKKDFTFIGYDRARVPKSDEARRLIRQHAMSDVAATRRQKGSYYRILPNHAAPQATEEGRVSEDPESLEAAQLRTRTYSDAESFAPGFNAWQEDVILYQRPTDEEQRFLLGQFPILQLIAPLTSLHLGIATMSCFTSRPALVGDIFTKSPLPSLQSRKLLSHIPSRYGKIPCLTYTVDCLVAKLEQIIDPRQQALPGSTSSPIDHGDTLWLYVKALRAVQAAIEDETFCLSAETLCALKLLQVFELLNQNPNPDPWVYHAGGAAKLIQLRGPGRFQTDFELALFMSLCGPIATEAFLSNRPCFLASGPWLQVIFTAIHDDPSIPSDQSQLIHELWSHLIFGPTLFQMVTDIVLAPTPASMKMIEDAISRIQQSLDHLHMWSKWLRERQLLNENNAADGATSYTFSASRASSDVTQRLPWRMLQGTHNMCLMLKRRMLTSLAPLRFRNVETQCQALAEAVVSGSIVPSSDGVEQLPNGLYMAQTAWVAKSIVETNSLWCDNEPPRALSTTTQENGVIGKAAFEAWCKALGRKTT